jgi:hypothetical protein
LCQAQVAGVLERVFGNNTEKGPAFMYSGCHLQSTGSICHLTPDGCRLIQGEKALFKTFFGSQII